MRVLQIYDHLGMSSGVTSVMMNWFRGIDREKIQFDFLVGYHREPSYEAEIRQMGGNIFYMSDYRVFGVKQLPGIAQNVKKFMRDHAHEYDAMHLHTTTFSYPYFYYAKKYGVERRICHIHGTQIGSTRLNRMRNTLMVLPLKFLANEFVACSQDAGEKYCPALKLKNFNVILNGIDLSKYVFAESNRQKVRVALGVEDKTFLAIHISNMTKIKNVPFAIRTFAKIAEQRPDSRFLLVGRALLPEDVQQQIQQHGLEGKIINLGVRSDVPELLAASDVCLMPSQTEGLGIVAVESQAAGTPVLTSKGFPQELYATELAVSLELDESLWAQVALEQKRKGPEDCREQLKRFEIACIAEQISGYYMSR